MLNRQVGFTCHTPEPTAAEPSEREVRVKLPSAIDQRDGGTTRPSTPTILNALWFPPRAHLAPSSCGLWDGALDRLTDTLDRVGKQARATPKRVDEDGRHADRHHYHRPH